VPDSAADYARRLAVGEFEAWLRQHRLPHSTGLPWPAFEYWEEVHAVTIRFLTGNGWRPPLVEEGQELPPLGPAGKNLVDVNDGIQEAALQAWCGVTGRTPAVG
jgi:hypothetical protein